MNRIDKAIRAKAQNVSFKLPEDYDVLLSNTFKNLENKPGSEKKLHLRNNIRTILIAAALVICLTASAVAVSNVRNWFVEYFTEKTGEELTESQIAVLAQDTAELGSSATYNGITVTAESITGDDYVVYVKLKIESEPGISLGEKELMFRWGAIYLPDMYDHSISSSCAFKMMNDESSSDNRAYMLLTLNMKPDTDGGPPLSGSSDKILGLEDLCDDFDEGEFNYVTKGIWKIKLSYDTAMDSIELISEPMQVYGDSLQDGKVRAKMTSFILSSFGATCTYVIDDNAPEQALDFSDVIVFMKDGTSVRLWPKRSAISGSDFIFDAPVSLDGVDYVQLDEKTSISLKQGT